MNNSVISFLEYDNGIYQGQTLQGRFKQGVGIYLWDNGSAYFGCWKSDHIDGQGVLFLPPKTMIQGVFRKDHLSGPASINYRQFTFQGSWKDSLPNGEMFAKTDNFDITMNFDQGRAIRSMPSKNNIDFSPYQSFDSLPRVDCDNSKIQVFQHLEGKFLGVWKHRNGKQYLPHGLGIFLHESCIFDIGFYREGQLSGIGRTQKEDGQTYHGEFLDGKQHGKGIQIFKKDSQLQFIKGNWRYGQIQNIIKTGLVAEAKKQDLIYQFAGKAKQGPALPINLFNLKHLEDIFMEQFQRQIHLSRSLSNRQSLSQQQQNTLDILNTISQNSAIKQMQSSKCSNKEQRNESIKLKSYYIKKLNMAESDARVLDTKQKKHSQNQSQRSLQSRDYQPQASRMQRYDALLESQAIQRTNSMLQLKSEKIDQHSYKPATVQEDFQYPIQHRLFEPQIRDISSERQPKQFNQKDDSVPVKNREMSSEGLPKQNMSQQYLFQNIEIQQPSQIVQESSNQISPKDVFEQIKEFKNSEFIKKINQDQSLQQKPDTPQNLEDRYKNLIGQIQGITKSNQTEVSNQIKIKTELSISDYEEYSKEIIELQNEQESIHSLKSGKLQQQEQQISFQSKSQVSLPSSDVQTIKYQSQFQSNQFDTRSKQDQNVDQDLPNKIIEEILNYAEIPSDKLPQQSVNPVPIVNRQIVKPPIEDNQSQQSNYSAPIVNRQIVQPQIIDNQPQQSNNPVPLVNRQITKPSIEDIQSQQSNHPVSSVNRQILKATIEEHQFEQQSQKPSLDHIKNQQNELFQKVQIVPQQTNIQFQINNEPEAVLDYYSTNNKQPNSEYQFEYDTHSQTQKHQSDYQLQEQAQGPIIDYKKTSQPTQQFTIPIAIAVPQNQFRPQQQQYKPVVKQTKNQIEEIAVNPQQQVTSMDIPKDQLNQQNITQIPTKISSKTPSKVSSQQQVVLPYKQSDITKKIQLPQQIQRQRLPSQVVLADNDVKQNLGLRVKTENNFEQEDSQINPSPSHMIKEMQLNLSNNEYSKDEVLKSERAAISERQLITENNSQPEIIRPVSHQKIEIPNELQYQYMAREIYQQYAIPQIKKANKGVQMQPQQSNKMIQVDQVEKSSVSQQALDISQIKEQLNRQKNLLTKLYTSIQETKNNQFSADQATEKKEIDQQSRRYRETVKAHRYQSPQDVVLQSRYHSPLQQISRVSICMSPNRPTITIRRGQRPAFTIIRQLPRY